VFLDIKKLKMEHALVIKTALLVMKITVKHAYHALMVNSSIKITLVWNAKHLV